MKPEDRALLIRFFEGRNSMDGDARRSAAAELADHFAGQLGRSVSVDPEYYLESLLPSVYGQGEPTARSSLEAASKPTRAQVAGVLSRRYAPIYGLASSLRAGGMLMAACLIVAAAIALFGSQITEAIGLLVSGLTLLALARSLAYVLETLADIATWTAPSLSDADKLSIPQPPIVANVQSEASSNDPGI